MADNTNVTGNSIAFSVDNAKSYIVAVRAGNEHGWSGWRNSPQAGPYTQPPPPTPSAVSLTRADQVLTASWAAVSGATKYHVTYTSDGGYSWTSAAHSLTGASIAFSVDNAKSYIVAVRAGNEHGWSDWRNSPPSAPIVPDAPASVTATRADGTVTANWPAVSDATKYHVTYSSDNEQSWTSASDNHAGNSITISNADNNKTYVVGVRAGNDYGWSAWRNSPPADPYNTLQPGISVQDTQGNDITALSVPEGGEASYQVKLTAPPSSPVKVCIGLSVRDKNDPDITFKGAAQGVVALNLNFTADNWDTFQTVTLVAAEDADTLDGQRDVGHDTRDYVHYWPGAINMTVTEIDNDLPAPTGLSVTPSGDNLNVSWNAVSGATGYDVRSSTDGSSWTTEHSNLSATSASVANANDTIQYIGVRATSATKSSPWAERSRMPSNGWLTTATGVTATGGAAMAAAQSGASAQSAQGQSQLAAPTWGDITRIRGRSEDAKLDLNWSSVSGATGYNIACSDTGGWSWHTCGWVDATDSNKVKYTSVPTSQTQPVSVTHYWRKAGESSKTPGIYPVIWPTRRYVVSIRAVNDTDADASPWTNSEEITPLQRILQNVTSTRTDGQITLSWDPNRFTTGYKIHCSKYVKGQSPDYTLFATLTNQDETAARHSVTLTTWSAGGTNYSIDNTSIWDIEIVSTNKWSEDSFLAPLIHPNPALTVSNIGVTGATLNIANHSGNWYYQADTSPDNTCQGPVSGSSKALTGLSPHTSYTYSASGCASADLLDTAQAFTTLSSSVSNLTSTKYATIESFVSATQSQAVAFATGSNAGGYVLKSITVPLKNTGGTNGVAFDLRAMSGTGTYSSTSQPSDTVLATLSFATLTASTYTDTTVTCSGSGCSLDPDTTYFITARTTDDHPAYSWAVSTSETETAQPSGNGWSVGFGHYKNDNALDCGSYSDWNIAEITFETVATLTPSNLTATGATLTIAGYPGANWYYKHTSPSGGTCSSAVSEASTTVTMGGGSYTFAAYSDASCSNLLVTTIAFSKDATPGAPSSPTSVATPSKELSTSWQHPLWATKYHVTYTCNNVGDWGLVANGAVASEGNLSQTGQTVTATVDLSGGWWGNNQSPACRMGVRAGNDNGWSSWAESNSVGPQ